jgi:transposase
MNLRQISYQMEMVIEVSLKSGHVKMRFVIYNTININKDVFIMGKHFDQEYKEYVSKLVVEEGRKAADVARELEISPKTISRWVSAYRLKQNGGSKANESYITPSELEKLKIQHMKELEQLKEENEILKKAMHIFTKNQA